METYSIKTPFGGDKRAGERLSSAHAELRGGASNWLSQHPNNWSGVPISIQYAKFERNRSSRSWDLEASPCTCARAKKVPIYFCTPPVGITGPHQFTKFERDRFNRPRERPLSCTCARAVAPNCDTWKYIARWVLTCMRSFSVIIPVITESF